MWAADKATTVTEFIVLCSDGKSYDAFLMCYKCDTAGGLNPSDKRWLESVLEEKFGYSLCLYDRDVLPGKGMDSEGSSAEHLLT